VRTDLFDYELPAGRIAQEPRPRGSSRLLVLDRKSGGIEHRRFSELPGCLRRGDLLVRNDVRVRHTRVWGRDREDRLVEIFFLEPVSRDLRRWLALAKPGRRAKAGRVVRLPGELEGIVREVRDDGRREIELPPYIRRPPGAPDRPEDRAAYQTVFAREPLAVAAPTAGLHFTEGTLAEIRERGVEIADLTLAVGAGTFKPVTADEIEAHAMEAESVVIPAATIRAAARARESGNRVVAVGTTVTRALEAAALRPAERPAEDAPLVFETDLFISPGFNFRAIDALLTNFHLPRSTLLMLVAAFAGRERALAAYEDAIREGYLFYSFGDAMLIV
jgi:S-adenosylmethionine:tRNA ribosyltransferase-isomerase